jgi:hypothetical protein
MLEGLKDRWKVIAFETSVLPPLPNPEMHSLKGAYTLLT